MNVKKTSRVPGIMRKGENEKKKKGRDEANTSSNLSLTVIEVGRTGDHSIANRLAKISLCSALHLFQHVGRDLRGAELLALLVLHPRVTVFRTDDLISNIGCRERKRKEKKRKRKRGGRKKREAVLEETINLKKQTRKRICRAGRMIEQKETPENWKSFPHLENDRKQRDGGRRCSLTTNKQ